MSAIVEPLSGGLVTARDASLLEPGELTVAEDVILKPGSTSIHRAPGRAIFNSTPLTAPTGIGYADFETGADKVVVVDGGSYKSAAAGLTGTFSTLDSGAGTSLEVVMMNGKAVLLSGASSQNKVLLSDGTLRPHGLLPVTTAPGLVHTSTGGSWPLGSTQLGWFEYWTTEVYKVGEGASADQDEVESTFIGKPASVNVTASTSHVTVRRPDAVNPGATHWRAYRSEMKTDQFAQAYPVGFLITDDIPIAQTEFEDGLASTSGMSGGVATTFPGQVVSPTTPEPAALPLGFNTTAVAWGTPTHILADDNVTAVSGSVSTAVLTRVVSQLVCKNFGFTGISTPVSNITLTIEGSKSAGAILTAYLSWDGGAHYTAGRGIPLSTSNATYTIDGRDWGRSWASTDFANGSFQLLLLASGAQLAGASTVTLDYVKVGITYNSSPASSTPTVQFPNVHLIISGEDVPIGANSPPPPATTGDVYQGTLVTNDTTAPLEVAWLVPGTVDYSPVPYRLNVGDNVSCIRAVGSALVVGCAGKKIRMNFLPVAEDPEFNTGRCVEPLDTDDGIINHNGMAKFVLNGQPMLFCVGYNSLKITDGYNITSATDDIIWTDLANIAQLSSAFVVNNAHLHEIQVYYPAAGSSTINKILRLCYHTSQLKNGKLKIAGISNFTASAATTGIDTTGERRLYTVAGTTVYVENQGFSDASGTGILPQVATREMHLAELGNSWEMNNVGIHHQGGGSTIDVSSTAAQANYPAESTSAKAVALTSRMLSLIDNRHSGDGVSVRIFGRNDGLPLTLDYLVLFAEGLGETTPLKQ